MLWTPPATRDPQSLAAAVDAALAELGARAWQVELAGPVVTQAILDAEKPTDEAPVDLGADLEADADEADGPG